MLDFSFISTDINLRVLLSPYRQAYLVRTPSYRDLACTLIQMPLYTQTLFWKSQFSHGHSSLRTVIIVNNELILKDNINCHCVYFCNVTENTQMKSVALKGEGLSSVELGSVQQPVPNPDVSFSVCIIYTI